jgi:hypothetical protein
MKDKQQQCTNTYKHNKQQRLPKNPNERITTKRLEEPKLSDTNDDYYDLHISRR